MPIETIALNTTPFIQTMLCGPPFAYSGPWAFWNWQMSILALNAESGAWQKPTGVWKAPSPPFVAGLLQRTGDFWQSVIGIAASKDVPKWLVWTGAPGNQADPDTWGLQVAKLENGTWRVKGCIDERIERTRTPVIVGDKAYSQGLGSINPPWFEFDLNLLTVQEGSDPGPGEEQADIAGFTYDLQIDPAGLSMPIPANYVPMPVPMLQPQGREPQVPSPPGARKFIATRSGVVTMPTYCPKDFVSRQHMAVFLLKTKYGASYTPPPATGTMFSDVPITHPYAAWIEQLAREGITAGKSPCEAP